MGVREQQKLETRARILKASKDLFCDEGFEVSMQKIAKNADVAAGTIFVHFSDKRELLVHVLFEDLKRAAIKGLKALNEEKPVLEQLLDCIAPIYRYYFRSPELSRTLLKEALFSANEVSKELLRNQASDFLEEIAKAIGLQLEERRVEVKTFLTTFFYLYLMNLMVHLNKPKQSTSGALNDLKSILKPILSAYGMKN